MPYFAKVRLMHQRFQVEEGKELVGCPKDLLVRWKEEGHIELRGDVEKPLIDLPFIDALSNLTQAQLVTVITDNGLPVRPYSNWPNEKIAQEIRNCCQDLSELKLPTNVPAGKTAE